MNICAAYGCTCPPGNGGRKYSPHECACGFCTNYRAMRNVCEERGIELTPEEHRLLQWLGHIEASNCLLFAGIIKRAFDAGFRDGDSPR